MSSKSEEECIEIKTIKVVVAIIRKDGSVFATQRGYGDYKDGWEFPGGKVEDTETPGASESINKWVDEGHEVSIITGRPFDSYEPSRRWLDEHHLERVPLYCVDKYGREEFT